MPKLSKPIEITLYSPEDGDIEATHRCWFVPWGLFKSIVRLVQNLDQADAEKLESGDLSGMSEEMADQMSEIVVALFGDRFTIEDLEHKTEFSDIMAVITQVMTLAGNLANPTEPVPAKQRSRSRH